MTGLHAYIPDATGRCTGGWYNDAGKWIACGSSQRSSILHDDPETEFRQMHWHNGGDCMCYENPDGPSYHEAMQAYVAAHR